MSSQEQGVQSRVSAKTLTRTIRGLGRNMEFIARDVPDRFTSDDQIRSGDQFQDKAHVEGKAQEVRDNFQGFGLLIVKILFSWIVIGSLILGVLGWLGHYTDLM